MQMRSRRFRLGLVALAVLAATTVLVVQGRDKLGLKLPQIEEETIDADHRSSKEVFSVLSLPPAEQSVELQQLADSGNPNQWDRNRARYLLAVQALADKEPDKALRQLEGLEKDYSLLSGHILLKRAKAYELKGDTAQAQTIWSQLTLKRVHAAVVAEATYQLGRYNSQKWEQLLTRFPEHPRAHEISRKRLADNPDQLQPLRILAHYTPEAEGMKSVRDRLASEYRNQLRPPEWESIAKGYWENLEYGKAAEAYDNAPKTARNFYRHARGLEISNENRKAKIAYLDLLNTFPDAAETGLALRRLADMVSPQDAIFYLDQAINQFPQQAPAALARKAELLEAQGKPQLAKATRNVLLDKYDDSEAANQYAWKMAKQQAEQGELGAAILWVKGISQKNNNNLVAAKAGFWAGKWLQQQGKTEAAKRSFEETLSQHPESYYGWRSAVHLNLPVGDFTSIRTQQPSVVEPASRPLLPAGSDLFKELYRLQEDRAAWQVWRFETAGKSDLSVEEQFTDGVLNLKQGRYLKGITQISSLKDRIVPEEIASWKRLRQQSMYWHHLFPFPYNDSIVKYSKKQELNPLLTISLIRQESHFEADIGSIAGAKGLMQIMPSTAEWVASQINLDNYSLLNPEHNLQLGTWYLGHVHNRYNNNSMLAIASYNAGSGNVNQWMDRYNADNPDEFVQQIPFPETKGYVEAVFSNYWNYLRWYNPDVQKLMQNY